MEKNILFDMRLARALEMLFCFLFFAEAASPPKPTIPTANFNVTAYGAVGDGTTDNSAAIQAAINAASAAGGGVVVVPPASKPYECGPIALASNLNLQIENGATLQCIVYSKYPLNDSAYVNFITAPNAHDIEISGTGTIDGQGADWWTAFNANDAMPHRPHLIKLSACTTVYVHDVTLSNSPMFHLSIKALNVTIGGITIFAPASAPNTDGIDPSGSNYLIEHCTISTGDDNIAIKPGNAACGNFIITNCTFGTGHGVSVGGQTNYGLDSLIVSHCSFSGTENGIRLKANRTNGGLVQNLSYSDITMDKVKNPVLFTSYYEQAFSAGDPAQPVTSTTPVWKNITIRNLVSSNSTNPAITLQGLPEMPIQNLTFARAVFTGAKNFAIAHAHGINFFNTTFNGASTGLTTSPIDATIFHCTITSSPKSQAVTIGSTLNLSVIATTDFTPSFQWFHDNTALVNNASVSGVNTSSVDLSNVQTIDGGSYGVFISDSAGGIFSDSAVIVVTNNEGVYWNADGRLSTKHLSGKNQCYKFIDPSGRAGTRNNAWGSPHNGVYLDRDPSGKWVRHIGFSK
jgi:polygalacturonase